MKNQSMIITKNTSLVYFPKIAMLEVFLPFYIFWLRDIFWLCDILIDVTVFLLSSLLNTPSFMLILSLVLELWKFSFIKDWPEIRKWKISPSEFCPISGDWDELGIPYLAWMSLIKYYWMQQNSIVTAFPVSELSR